MPKEINFILENRKMVKEMEMAFFNFLKMSITMVNGRMEKETD